MTAGVALLRTLGNATTQLRGAGATPTATAKDTIGRLPPMTGRELRAQLIAQQRRNEPASTVRTDCLQQLRADSKLPESP